MRRAILLVAVMLTAILGASSALAYAQQSEMPVPPDKNGNDKNGNSDPITIENHSWGGYHWARTSNPFTLKLGDNVSSDWDPILATTSTDWSKATVLDTQVVAGGTKPGRCRPTAGRDEVCNASYGNTGWLGVATIWVSGKHITQGTVKLNDYYHNSPPYNTTAWRNLVSCQEVGHTLGLDHQDENFDNANLGTCMDYTSAPGTNQHPNQGDYDELLCIYDPSKAGQTLSTKTHSCTGTGHLDSTTTVGAASTPSRKPPTGDPGNNDSSNWGHEFYRSADGRVSLYKLDLGNAHAKLTWVRWTEKEAKRRAHNTGPSSGSTRADSPVPETTNSRKESTST